MSEPIAEGGPTDRVPGFHYGFRCRVDLADTDLGKVVYYARYPHYLDRGVIEYRRHLGIPSLGPEGHLFVVASLQVDYRSSARFDDRVEVLVEGTHPDSELLLRGRTAGQAPEIDGQVIINDGSAEAGTFVTVEITEAHPYDLVGRVVPA